jgi:hypothetical protein
MHDSITLIGLAASLLGTLVVSTWRFASLATKLTATIEKLEEKVERVEAGLVTLEKLPELRIKVDQLDAMLSKISSEFPRLVSRCDVLELAIKHSREMRAVLVNNRPGSKPDLEDE